MSRMRRLADRLGPVIATPLSDAERQARMHLDLGVSFPYNERQPESIAEFAAQGVLNELCDRHGVGDELENVDKEIRQEIAESLTTIIHRAYHPSTGMVKNLPHLYRLGAMTHPYHPQHLSTNKECSNMEARVEVVAEGQELANALTAAVNQGLADAGFTNVTATTVIDEPQNLLAHLREKAPELFSTAVELNTTAIEEQEEVDDVANAESGDADQDALTETGA